MNTQPKELLTREEVSAILECVVREVAHACAEIATVVAESASEGTKDKRIQRGIRAGAGAVLMRIHEKYRDFGL